MAEPARYRRNRAASETEIEGEMFLVEPESQEVYHLDQTGSALWRLLDAPQGFDDILSVFRDAFPDIAPDALGHDLRRTLDRLVEKGLVEAVNDDS